MNSYIKKYYLNDALHRYGHLLRQYDQLVGGQLIAGGLAKKKSGAAVVKCPDSNKALAISVDSIPRYVQADPYLGTLHIVCESYRNIICVNAKPLAITNNLNFGNPEKPIIMGQIVGAIKAMKDACSLLDYPVISGNVSLYNETNGVAIRPTPVIGGIGILSDYKNTISMQYQCDEHILLIGDNKNELGCSRYAELHGFRDKFAPPECSVASELKHGQFVLQIMALGLVSACHDVSTGGLLINLLEMANASKLGFDCHSGAGMNDINYWFSESAHCYIITTKDKNNIWSLAKNHNIPISILGTTINGDCYINRQKLTNY